MCWFLSDNRLSSHSTQSSNFAETVTKALLLVAGLKNKSNQQEYRTAIHCHYFGATEADPALRGSPSLQRSRGSHITAAKKETTEKKRITVTFFFNTFFFSLKTSILFLTNERIKINGRTRAHSIRLVAAVSLSFCEKSFI